ncbi:MAG: biotin transporter BioY [Candidatus Acidiferrales bacterium]
MSETKVLADRILPVEGVAADAVRIVAATILLALCAHIVIPLPWTPVPITGQTFGVLLIAVLLGARRGALAVILYLIEGAAGLPVFQPLGAPGVLRFAGPTSGYLMSYPFAAYVTGWMSARASSAASHLTAAVRAGLLAGALIAGEIVIFFGGCAWLASGLHLGWRQAVTLGALPFLPGELIKMALILAAVGGVEIFRHRD